jgi:predicted secreted protein
MIRRACARLATFAVVVLATGTAAHAADDVPVTQPVVTVSASAHASVANDRMRALLRAESDDTDPSRAANAVNARIARATEHAKSQPGVVVANAGYSTFEVGEPANRRWRVVQTIALESSDFAALAALLTRLQQDDGMLLSGVDFSVSPGARRRAEDALMRDAIRDWQARARLAAQAFRANGWRAGHVSVQTSDVGRPVPMFRAQAMSAAPPAPVNVEAGTSDIAVTVSGEAILQR